MNKFVDLATSFVAVAGLGTLYFFAADSQLGTRLIKESIFFFYLSGIFLLAAKYHQRSSVLRLIRLIANTVSYPQRPYMVVVYASLFAVVAIVQSLRWIFADSF